MSTTIVLGSSSLEITANPLLSNSTELIPRRNISGVYAVKFQQRQVGNTDWVYPRNTITRIVIHIFDGRKLTVELQDVSNQPTWNAGTLAAQKQAVADINDWLLLAPQINYIEASGGTLTYDVGNRRVHEFKSSGTFTTTQLGTGSLNDMRVLVVGGAAGGGGMDTLASGNSSSCGGAGGGVLESFSIPAILGSESITVGTGGLGGFVGNNYIGTNGTNSSFRTLVSIGGGHGAGSTTTASGGNGGSGGGSMVGSPAGLGTSGQGFNGGVASGLAPNYGGSGGGGATQAGANGTGIAGGKGGEGYTSNITGANQVYGSGGGGGVYLGGTRGLGGTNAGNAGLPIAGQTTGQDGAANKGAGGGSASHPGGATILVNFGGKGSNGTVIISYQIAP